MTRSEKQLLLRKDPTDEYTKRLLTRENNQLLKLILRLVLHDEGNNFMTNVVANLLSNKIDRINIQ